jgi:group II intron reverse transcriptase/maturase
MPKSDGGIRQLGIPAIIDRVGQMVIKRYVEPRMEEFFSPNSYGYRPNKSAHQALESVRLNCRSKDWVIDLDIKGFFDHIPHDKLLLAVEKHVPERWVLLYLRRWLEAPTQLPSGEIRNNTGFGTPQGGVISPLLSNLFLHYGLDQWLENHRPNVCYSRYADDAIIHCESKLQADFLLSKIKARMESIGLSLHPKKTQIVYCSDQRRRLKYSKIKFDFLGYSFQPRVTSSRKTKGLFVSFDCAISIKSKKRIADRLGELKVERLRFKSVVGIAQYLNPMIRGWINYYGKFRRSNMHPVFRLLHQRIIRWLRYRFKRYKTSIRRAYAWLKRVQEQYPSLFYHWQVGFKD